MRHHPVVIGLLRGGCHEDDQCLTARSLQSALRRGCCILTIDKSTPVCRYPASLPAGILSALVGALAVVMLERSAKNSIRSCLCISSILRSCWDDDSINKIDVVATFHVLTIYDEYGPWGNVRVLIVITQFTCCGLKHHQSPN